MMPPYPLRNKKGKGLTLTAHLCMYFIRKMKMKSRG